MSEPKSEKRDLLADQFENLQKSSITREEFDQLKALVQRLASRLEEIAPADQIPDEHLAIMSAVFAATIGKRFKIRQVQHLAEPGGWAQAGRVNLHAQRHVRRS
jgi:hypothetical protein